MMICPHCGKDLSANIPVIHNANVNAAAGCQPTWQGTFVWNGANAVSVQFNQPVVDVFAAAGAANPGIFQYIKL